MNFFSAKLADKKKPTHGDLVPMFSARKHLFILQNSILRKEGFLSYTRCLQSIQQQNPSGGGKERPLCAWSQGPQRAEGR